MPTRLVLLVIGWLVGLGAVAFFLYGPLMKWLTRKTTDRWIKDFDRKMSIAKSGSEFENEIREAKKGN